MHTGVAPEGGRTRKHMQFGHLDPSQESSFKLVSCSQRRTRALSRLNP